MKMQFIGDVHCKTSIYYSRLEPGIPSIQVGDFGFKKEHDWHIRTVDADMHKINFGNHDYIPYVNQKHSLGNYGVWNGVYSIRGARSIDSCTRTEGVDWFHDEEMTYRETMDCLDDYMAKKPKVVVSHDCPNKIRTKLFDIWERDSTTNLLQACLDAHKPKLWVFGHHHKKIDQVILGTRFVCLGIREARVFEV